MSEPEKPGARSGAVLQASCILGPLLNVQLHMQSRAAHRSRPSRLGASDVPPPQAFPLYGSRDRARTHGAGTPSLLKGHADCMPMPLACRWALRPPLRPPYLAAPQGAPGPPPIRAGTEYVRTSDSSPLQCTCQIRAGEGPRAKLGHASRGRGKGGGGRGRGGGVQGKRWLVLRAGDQ